MKNRNHSALGFSIIELLIVIAIIALLLGILLPVVSRIRESGRSTACLANVQQWGYVYQMYLNANHGKGVPEWESPVYQTPWQVLDPYGKSSAGSLLCPSAREPKSWTLSPVDQQGQSGIRGSASHAWVWKNQLGAAVGSYGFNTALFDISKRQQPPSQPFFFPSPARQPDRIPLICDSMFWTIVGNGDKPPVDLESPEDSNSGLSYCCINRHRMAINVVFLDGHAEHVPLPALYRLQWYIGYVQHDVVIPGA